MKITDEGSTMIMGKQSIKECPKCEGNLEFANGINQLENVSYGGMPMYNYERYVVYKCEYCQNYFYELNESHHVEKL